MNRTDVADRLAHAIRNSGSGAISGVCSGCGSDIDLEVDAPGSLADRLIDELERDGLKIVRA